MHLGLAVLMAVQLAVSTGGTCPGMQLPVEGSVVQTFEPIDRYGGHWGIDISAPRGTPVSAADGGIVSFAGVVVSNRTVTVGHGGGVKSSYSYLDSLDVAEGDRIERGEVLGWSGVAHGVEAVHFSVRIDGTYIDPVRMVSCRLLDLTAALRLVPTSQDPRSRAYPVDREKGHSRRNVRSATYRTFDCR